MYRCPDGSPPLASFLQLLPARKLRVISLACGFANPFTEDRVAEMGKA